jgi:hypothetical protein
MVLRSLQFLPRNLSSLNSRLGTAKMNDSQVSRSKVTKESVNNRLSGRGIVLSGAYLKYHTKTSFLCSEGHSWNATPANVLYGYGCPHCSGNIPLTKQIVNVRIADRGLVMLGEYVHQSEKAMFLCGEGHTWETAPSNVLYGNGCPKCGRLKAANKKRLSKDTIRERLAGRDIDLIGEYSNANAKTMFRCGEGHAWNATPGSVISGNGCPHCSGRAPLTKAIVIERIANRGITLLGDYISTSAKTLFRCNEGHTWTTAASHVISGTGCPHCDGQAPLSKEIVNERIASRGIVMLGDYKNVDTKALFRCNEAHTWETTPYHVMRQPRPTGCPYCSEKAPLSTAILNDRIKDRGLVLLDEFRTNHLKIRFQCSAGHVWEAKPNNILNGRGCPECSERTSDNNVFYLWLANRQRLVDLQLGEFLIKYGTSSERLEYERINDVANNWKAIPNVLAMVKTLEPATMIEQLASRIGRRLTPDYSGLDGWTEFRVVNRDELTQLMSIAAEVADYKIVWNDTPLVTDQIFDRASTS